MNISSETTDHSLIINSVIGRNLSTASEKYVRDVYIQPDVFRGDYFTNIIGYHPKNMTVTPASSSISNSKKDNLFDKLTKEIIAYCLLEDDWDGYDGVAPKEEVAALAINFLSQINLKKLSLPKHMLSGSGSISLYWEDKINDVYIEVAFDETELYSYFIKDSLVKLGGDDISLIRNGIESPIMDGVGKIQGSKSIFMA